MVPIIVARHYLRQIIDSKPVDGRLPTITQLAHSAGVGSVTMWRAVREMRDAQVLTCAPRKGISIVNHPVVIQDTDSREPLKHGWRCVHDLIMQDIVHGRLSDHHPLPSIKTLEHRYGVNYRTLRHALRSLVNEKILAPYGKTFTFAANALAGTRNRIILCTQASSPLVLDLLNERNLELYRILESECARTNLVVDLLSVDLFAHTPNSFITPNTLGIIIWNREKAPSMLIQLGALLKRQYPLLSIVHIDETGFDIPQSGKNVVITAAGGQTPGLHMGLHLLRKGHRKIAFFSAVNVAPWSRARLSGLTQAFFGAGYHNAVLPFTDDTIGSPAEQTTPSRSSFSVSIDSLHSVPALNNVVLNRAATRLTLQVPEIMKRECIIEKLQPLFKKALIDKSITAWVAAEDLMAIGGQDFLNMQGNAANHVTAVAGFDDSLEASLHNLTSYNFNMHAVAVNAIRRIAYPQWHNEMRKKKNTLLHIDGFITERSSTRRNREPTKGCVLRSCRKGC